MKLLFFDTETTGLPKDRKAPVEQLDNWPRLVQIAWQVYDNNILLKEYSYLIKPNGFQIPEESINIHKITNEKALENGKEIDYILRKFYFDLISSDILIAHNYYYDSSVLASELIRNKLENIFNTKEHFCTMELSKDLCKIIAGSNGYKWPSLEELYRFLFNKNFNAHNALDDVKATAKCFWELILKGTIPNNSFKILNSKIQDQRNSIIKDNDLLNRIYKAHKESIISNNKLSVKSLEIISKIFQNIGYMQKTPDYRQENIYPISKSGKIEHLIFCFFYVEFFIEKQTWENAINLIKELKVFLIEFINIYLLHNNLIFNNSIDNLIDHRFSIYTEEYSWSEEGYQLIKAHHDAYYDLENNWLRKVYSLVYFYPLKIVDNYHKGNRTALDAFHYEKPELSNMYIIFESIGIDLDEYPWMWQINN